MRKQSLSNHFTSEITTLLDKYGLFYLRILRESGGDKVRFCLKDLFRLPKLGTHIHRSSYT